MRALVRVESDVDRALLRRVLGYTSDLPRVVIEETSTGPLESRVADQLEVAEGLATRRGARAVIWFHYLASGARDRVRVYVCQPDNDHLLVRDVDARRAGKAGLSSAALEAAALVVQSSLRAIEEGQEVGTAPSRAAIVEESPAAPPPAAVEGPVWTPPPSAPPPTVELVSTQPGRTWVASFGGQWIADGQTGGEFGVTARLGIEATANLEVGACVSSTLPTELRDSYAAVELSRLTLAFCGRYTPVRKGSLSLALAAEVGYGAFYRTTGWTAPSVSGADPGWSSSPLVGGALVGRWAMAGSFALVLAAGTDWMAGAPKLSYDVSGQLQGGRALWQLQPRVQLAFEVGLP